MRIRIATGTFAGWLGVTGALLFAQMPAPVDPAAKSMAMAATLPGYDVISIHRNKIASGEWSFQTTDDGLIAENVTFSDLVQFAYNLGSAELISGISGPLASAHFDVRAKMASADGSKSTHFSDEQLQAMMIPLLAERFHLHVLLVPKTMTVYELVVAKGGLRIKLTEPETNNDAIHLGFSDNDNTLTAKRTTMPDLAQALSGGPLHRIVVDRTGLKGEGDFTLKWSSETAEDQGGPNVISIFTAIQEQLGLELQPAKTPVDTLVVAHAEMPADD